MSIIYLNGHFQDSENACVSVMDRGFLFGDGVYEVIPAYGKQLFRLPQHLTRLENSLSAIHIKNPHNQTQWESILNELIQHNPGIDQSIYLQITRGSSQIRDHAFPANIDPTIFVMSTLIPSSLDEHPGISAITLDDIRWQYCHIKAITLLPNVLLRQQALQQGADDAILIREGYATEGAASNLFIVDVNNTLITPPKSKHLLPGITRDLILELAAENQLNYQECNINTAQLASANEIWLTSSTKEVIPVIKLNNKPVGTGEPGQIWTIMKKIYKDYKEKLRSGNSY